MEKERRLVVVAIAAVVIASIATIFFAPSQTTIPIPEPREIKGNSTGSGIQVLANNLEVPWAIDIAEDGRIFFTERPGRIGIIDNGTLLEPTFIKVEQKGESGLLGLALHPNFTRNHLLYIYQTYSNGSGVFNKVVMLKEKDNKFIESKDILEGIPAADRNDGGRIKFGPDGELYISTGDAGQSGLAQDTGSLAGKILRINPDGTIPKDNPFKGSPVYSYGHRNIQGLAWNSTGQMYASEHGADGYDEINLIRPGANYGWPTEQHCEGKQFEAPIVCFQETIAPSGIAIAKSDRLGYKNDVILAALKGKQLRLIQLPSEKEVNILTGYGRIRDVVEAHDGTLYVTTSNRDGGPLSQPEQGDDKILRITQP